MVPCAHASAGMRQNAEQPKQAFNALVIWLCSSISVTKERRSRCRSLLAIASRDYRLAGELASRRARTKRIQLIESLNEYRPSVPGRGTTATVRSEKKPSFRSCSAVVCTQAT